MIEQRLATVAIKRSLEEGSEWHVRGDDIKSFNCSLGFSPYNLLMAPQRFKSCVHTCPHDDELATQVSRRPSELRTCYILDARGKGLERHESSKQMHPSCTNKCPGHLSVCNPCDCPPLSNPPCYVKGRDPTHQEWLLWGQVLYNSLTLVQKADWPLYYKDMAAGGLQPVSPDPLIDIWRTSPAPASQPLFRQPVQGMTSTASQNSPPHSPAPIKSSQSFASSPLSGPHKDQTSLPHTTEPSKINTDHGHDLSAIIIEEVSCHKNSMGWGRVKMPEEIAKRIFSACPNNIKRDAGADTYLVSEYVGTFWISFRSASLLINKF
jgi:hypothetical protein